VKFLGAFVGEALVGSASAALAGPPSGLSTNGRALWNFEALLHDSFGSRDVCTKGASLNFSAPANECSPLATYGPYLYQFAGPRHSAFHLVSRLPRASFGNYPQPVRINGRFIACGPRPELPDGVL
jgi:hypothetical protein